VLARGVPQVDWRITMNATELTTKARVEYETNPCVATRKAYSDAMDYEMQNPKIAIREELEAKLREATHPIIRRVIQNQLDKL
jgi:hypothetical protein